MNSTAKIMYTANAENFSKIPGSPIAYWVSDKMMDCFCGAKTVNNYAKARQGMKTLDNNLFIRKWFEISFANLYLNAQNASVAKKSGLKWFPINHGGEYRKYYGNNLEVVNWHNDGYEMKTLAVKKYGCETRTITNIEHYFKRGLTWTAISSGRFSIRYFGQGFLFSNAGFCMFDCEDLLYLCALLNSKITTTILLALSPTINFNVNDIARLPVIISSDIMQHINEISGKNINLCHDDWDSFETSWDFTKHPLLQK